MGFKTFNVGDVLTAADVNDYLMEQVVIVCTSGTRPSSPNEGMTIYETDTDLFRVYTGSAWVTIGDPGAWTDYTPTWTATTTNPSLGNGTISGRSKQIGKTVHATGRILLGSTTTVGTGDWRISLPTEAQTGTLYVGTGIAYDSSNIPASRPVAAWLADASTLRFTSPAGEVASTTPFAWAQSDQLRWSYTYEAL